MPGRGRSSSLRLVAVWLCFIVLAGAPVLPLDVVLDPEVVAKLLAEIGKLREESVNGRARAARVEALYQMGERVISLTNLMTKDLQEHGFSDQSMVSLISRRLKQYGIQVSSNSEGFDYDLAAFREYVQRAPKGKRAADARFVLMAFRETPEDIGQTEKAIAEKERFIRDYPRYSAMSITKLLLGRDHLRLGRLYSAQNSALSERHRAIAEKLFREITKLYPNTPEAQEAANYLFRPRPPK